MLCTLKLAFLEPWRTNLRNNYNIFAIQLFQLTWKSDSLSLPPRKIVRARGDSASTSFTQDLWVKFPWKRKLGRSLRDFTKFRSRWAVYQGKYWNGSKVWIFLILLGILEGNKDSRYTYTDQMNRLFGYPKEWETKDFIACIFALHRDFSNGYLVAEIFSWYFPEEIEMHSYDNGTSLPSRQGNWSQLQRVRDFRKYLMWI